MRKNKNSRIRKSQLRTGAIDTVNQMEILDVKT